MAIRFGPVRNRQFPFALLGRALSVWRQLAVNVPGDAKPPQIRDDWQVTIGNKLKRALNRQFVQIGKDSTFAQRSEIERLLKAGGEVGKRLDFLIQELHREANTMGSKSSNLELTRISVDMKVLIEQMREQVQNIE